MQPGAFSQTLHILSDCDSREGSNGRLQSSERMRSVFKAGIFANVAQFARDELKFLEGSVIRKQAEEVLNNMDL